MRRFYVLPALLGYLLFGLSACRRHNDLNELRGRVIMPAGCGTYIIQLLQGSLPPDRINASWKDPLTDSVYTNVFTVTNYCDFPASKATPGNTIAFRVDNSNPPPAQTCVICMWYRPAPAQNNVVLDVRTVN